MKRNRELDAHKAWLGFVQPAGLVVSPPALVKAQCVLQPNPIDAQAELRALTRIVPVTPDDASSDGDIVTLDDFASFAETVLEWQPDDLIRLNGSSGVDGDHDEHADLLASVEVVLPEYRDRLTPTYVVPDPDLARASAGDDTTSRHLLLVRVWPRGTALDETAALSSHSGYAGGWHASPQARFERLLRETGVHVGILFNHTHIRLVYAPRGETAGHITFPIAAMCQVAGRPILGALSMLLHAERVFNAPAGRRLTDVLRDSRKYQNEVSTKLAEQVLGALWELLRGFQMADRLSGHGLLADTQTSGDTGDGHDRGDYIQGGLTTTLLRLVFLLYAEDQGLMPDDDVFVQNYAVSGLYARLREDAGQYPDTMDQRFGAWSALLSLFRMVYDGSEYHSEGGRGFRLPTRHGQLFSPDAYPFLEGRPRGVARVMGERISPPRVPDGTVYRVLEALLVLDGERLSYSGLDVEQIGSVYEAMMGFSVERAPGRSIGVKSDAHKPGAVRADPVVNVDTLLAQKPAQRVKWLLSEVGCKLTGASAKRLKQATTPEEVVAALGRRRSARTPHVLPAGALYLQPGEERRRSGSHYTPRELTGPIVETTLAPVLAALTASDTRSVGARGPTPAQILALKVCDPAMGSGAFLVEACRQLADALVTAWQVHDARPGGLGDDEALPYARRLVAQHCLYGVDKNPFAVALAKLSLWLVTLAKDHAFTFLDHALKCGDSLVGLTRAQIGAFHWQVDELDHGPLFQHVRAAAHTASDLRAELRALGDDRDREKRAIHREAEDALHAARMTGDAIVAAFFAADKARHRETQRQVFQAEVNAWRAGDTDDVAVRERVAALRVRGVRPFHWELEFPEVFARDNPGFDAMVGNPPFAGKNTTIRGNAPGFLDWLKMLHEQSHGNADLCAHFFRRAFMQVREHGAFGLIATNTIAQGDTRSTGLRWICTHGGTIYAATRRRMWPGMAAVVVSVVHVTRSSAATVCILDGRQVPRITAFLFHRGGHDDPYTLDANAGKSFQGSIVLGMGFTFDDTDTKDAASPISEMHRLIAKDPRNAERIFPYLGGSEVNTSPTHAHHRYVINFAEMTEDEARQWPDLMTIIEAKVKGTRGSHSTAPWWQFERLREELYEAIAQLKQVAIKTNCSPNTAQTYVITIARHQPHWAVARLLSKQIFSEALIVFPFTDYSAFTMIQSRVHEVWARFFGSTMKDDLRYTARDCFETFPFPADWQHRDTLEAAGAAYHDYRAQLMIDNDEGLTKTYNRFHDPDERDPRILRLRELHADMDRAVLDAYGWTDIDTHCEFLLDYDIDEASWNPKKKKPYRYRWSESVHDEVLARLLELNAQRAAEERHAGKTADAEAKASKRSKPRRKRTSKKTREAPHPGTLDLFAQPDSNTESDDR